MIRPMQKKDRASVSRILRQTDMFSSEEIQVAEELIDLYLKEPDQKDYEIMVIEDGADVAGYLCFGPTPATDGTYDLYWIAVSPAVQGKGFGKKLVSWLENDLQNRKARMIIIETSSQPKYESTRKFYLKTDYKEVARIPDFYKTGDDRVIYAKYLYNQGRPRSNG